MKQILILLFLLPACIGYSQRLNVPTPGVPTNGLQTISTSIGLGGNLTQNTNINGTFDLRYGNTTRLDTFLVSSNDLILNMNASAGIRKFLHKSGGYGGGLDSLYNLFLGYNAGQFVTGTGYANVAIGSNAGLRLSGTAPQGSSSVFVGAGSGETLTTGSFNTVVGARAMSGTLGTIDGCTAMGHHALKNAQVGNLTAFGRSAGELTTTGTGTFLGYFAGAQNTVGTENTYVGTTAGRINVLGIQNTFIGHETGFSSVNTTASGENTFVGYRSGYTNTTGTLNTFLGALSGRFNTTGISNTFVGRNSGEGNTTGQDNTYIGLNAGSTKTTGSSNIYIGRSADGASVTASNELNIGNILFGLGVNVTKSTGITNGKIGVGVDNPGAKLHVLGSIRADSMLIVRGTNSTGVGLEMINTTPSTGVNWSFESRNAGDLQFWRNGTYRGRFAGTGLFWQGAGSFGPANSTVAESLISATDSSASTNAIAVENKLTGDATFIAKTATSGGDPKLLFVNNTTTAGYIGADRTDSLAVIMGLGSAVGTNARMRASAAGIALGINPAAPTNGAEVRLQGDIIIDRVIANSPKPSCLYVAANGSSGTCTVTYGGDLAFHFEAQSGDTPALADYLAITFANPLPLDHKPVALITPALLGGVGSVYQLYVDESNKFNTGFRIKRDGTSLSAFGGDVHVISGY